MPDIITEMFTQMRELTRRLSASQRVSLMVATAAVIAVIMVTAIWSQKPQFQPLFSGAGSEDLAEIADILNGKGIPYRLSADGTGISVPSDRVQEARLQIAGEGISVGGGAGFELFDSKNMGMTEFMQKLNFQRALQGELARTIAQLSEVEQARVHIVMPKESIFEDKKGNSSASVVIKLKGGRALSQSQISGITQLVANAVEGLKAEGVTIIDSKGNVLTKGERGGASRVATTNLEVQRAYEEELEKKVTSMLERGVGTGKSTVRVAAVMDFERMEKVEETFDPDRVVIRSEQRSEERHSDGESAPAGAPGVEANLLEGKAGTAMTSNSNKKSETINYEISRVTKKTVKPLGKIQRLSVAVLIDGTYEVNEDGEKRYIPRSDKELKTYENLVKKVVGFDPERGDQIEIASVPFEAAGAGFDPAATLGKGERYQFWVSLARNLSVALLGLLFFVLVLRPLVKWLVRPVEGGLLLEGGPKTVEEMEAALLEQEGGEGRAASGDKLLKSANGDSDVVYNVIKRWMEE